MEKSITHEDILVLKGRLEEESTPVFQKFLANISGESVDTNDHIKCGIGGHAHVLLGKALQHCGVKDITAEKLYYYTKTLCGMVLDLFADQYIEWSIEKHSFDPLDYASAEQPAKAGTLLVLFVVESLGYPVDHEDQALLKSHFDEVLDDMEREG